MENFGWQATFFTIIPIAILLLVIIWRFVHIRETPQETDPSSIERLIKNDKESGPVPITNSKRRKRGKLQLDVKGAQILQYL